jgi:hypothetical protein
LYQYRIVVPAQLVDEVENVVRPSADVSIEGLISTPEDIAPPGEIGLDEDFALHPAAPLAVLAIQSQDLESVVRLKEWLGHRFVGSQVDIRLQATAGRSSLSFQEHTPQEIKDWIQERAA